MTKGLPAAVLTGALAAASLLHAQARPDFSGTWTMDLARSESTRQGEPIKPPVTVIIAQTAADVRVETTRGDQKETVVYPLGDSRRAAAAAIGSSFQPEAFWDGDKLVTQTQRQVQGYAVTVKEVRSLASDGREMIMETAVIVQHGYTMPGVKNYGTARDVFTRLDR